MNHLSKLVVFYPKTVITVWLAITLLLAAVILARGIEFNGSPQTLARNDEALRFYNEVKEGFGDDNVIIVAITTGEIFTNDSLVKLDRLTRRLSAVPGVAEVISLSNLKAIRRYRDEIKIESLIPPSFSTASVDQMQKLKQEITRDPLYARHYVSEDGRTAALSLFMKPVGEAQSRALAEEVERVAKAEAGADELMLAGVPIMDARGVKSMVRDVLVCSPLAFILCFVVFLFSFRSFWGAVIPMAALMMGLVWTIGLMSLAGTPITLATLSLPTVLLAVGSSYIFHVINQYRISSAGYSGTNAAPLRQEWFRGLKFIGPSVFVSGATTVAGFGALGSSSVPAARDMGIYEAIGVAFMLIISLAFVPAVLALLRPSSLTNEDRAREGYATWLNKPLKIVTALILHRSRLVLTVSMLLTLGLGAGAYWMRASTDYLRIFPASSETVRDAEKLHARLAGAATFQLVISGEPGSITRPDLLKGVEALERFARTQPGVDATLSVADIVKRFHSVFDTREPRTEELPSDPRQIESIFDDYLSQDESLGRLISRDRSRAVIVLKTNLFNSTELRALTTKLEDWGRANLPEGVSARATGSFVLLNDASDAVAASQYSSLAIALISIYLMMALLFRSFSTGLLALLPNLLPIIGYFGFLGWMSIPLDITTSLVASAVLGLAVDNAVHMVRRYRQSVAERLVCASGKLSPEDEGWAMWLTMLRTGKPMVLANVMLMAAYLIFVLSSFVPVRTAGILWAFAIFASLVTNLVFLPVLMKSRPFDRAALGQPVEAAEEVAVENYASVQEVGK